MSNRSDTRGDPSVADSGDCRADSVDEAAVARSVRAAADGSLLLRTAALFSAMGDPTRLRMLEALATNELCVCDLSRITCISQSGVSHQLRLLRELGLVAFRRDANRAVYRLADEHVRILLRQGFEHADEGGAR